MDHLFFQVFIEFATILPLFYVLVFWPKSILAPQPGIEPTASVLGGQVFTLDHQGAPCNNFFNGKLINN